MSIANYFYSRQFHLEGGWFRNAMMRILKGSQKALDNFLQPESNPTTIGIGMALAAKSKKPAVGQATTLLLN